MALEAVVFSQAGGGHFGYGLPWCDQLLGSAGAGPFSVSGDICAGDYWDHELHAWAAPGTDDWEEAARPVSTCRDQSSDASTEDHCQQGHSAAAEAAEPPAAPAAGRRKRRRAKAVKNQEEIETQRMTHIAVERNRRRQMNEYLAVLRSLMPPSYAHRGDQASIVGGAINYVRELEQLLQSLQVQKSVQRGHRSGGADASPFAGFFSFPQYSTSSAHGCCSSTSIGGGSCNNNNGGDSSDASSRPAEGAARTAAAIADIEVTMVEGHASLKVLVRRQPKQLLKLVAGLHQLRIPPLHLNMTSVDAMVLYTFSLKVEDDSKMGSVEDIAAAVHEILGTMEEETAVM